LKYGIQAVANVLTNYPHVEYRIVGDGPLKSELQDLIDSLNVEDKIKLLGWKRQEEIVNLTEWADIFLAPSVTSEDGDQEGIPVVLMEAMAQGLPILSTLHSGIPELIQDGVSGFLVSERDVEALTDKLEYLITHPEIWPEMGRAGRDHVERHFNIDMLNDRLVKLYQQLLTGRWLDKSSDIN
jgi:colanic acid/amylovoran biosynthesis glycosyltransferase